MIIEDLSTLSGAVAEGPPSILQEFIESTVEGWTFSKGLSSWIEA